MRRQIAPMLVLLVSVNSVSGKTVLLVFYLGLDNFAYHKNFIKYLFYLRIIQDSVSKRPLINVLFTRY